MLEIEKGQKQPHDSDLIKSVCDFQQREGLVATIDRGRQVRHGELCQCYESNILIQATCECDYHDVIHCHDDQNDFLKYIIDTADYEQSQM